jgi:hypothetical protein
VDQIIGSLLCSQRSCSLGFLSEWAVMLAEDGIVLNYYGPSIFKVQIPSGQSVNIEQITDYTKKVEKFL